MCVRLRWVLCLAVLLVVWPLGVFADLEPVKDSVGNTLAFTSSVPLENGPSLINEEQAKVFAFDFANKNRAIVGVANPDSELYSTSVHRDQLGSTRVHLRQIYKGVPVRGEVLLNFDQDGNVRFVSAKTVRNLPLSVKPRIKRDRAKKIALRNAYSEKADASLHVRRGRLAIVPLDLLGIQASGAARLVWELLVEDPDGLRFSNYYFIDAISGEVLREVPAIQHSVPPIDVNREILDCAKSPGIYGCWLDSLGINGYFHGRSELAPVRGPHNRSEMMQYNSIDVDNSWEIAADLHQFVWDEFGLVGANNRGGSRTEPQNELVTRLAIHTEGPSGDWVYYCPHGAVMSSTGTLGVCLHEVLGNYDLIGHEFTHAITLNLFRDLDDYGVGPDPLIPDVNALEEAFGDLVGELYEFRKSGSADWKLGTFYLPEEPFRDLANPYNSQEPNLGTYSKRYYDQNVNCDEGTENGGYYLNSTIVSHALYLAANGGELNGCEVTGRADGEEFATRIFARAWLTYFDSQESFAGAYAKLLLACQDLYSFEDCLELEKALQAVQLDQPGACSTVPESGPACAVQHGGSAVSCRPDATVSDLFAPTENIWTDLSAATPYETVDVYYVPNDPDRPKWQVLSTVALDSRTDVPIDGGGIAATDVTVASTPGTYDIIIDGNQDGMFQPWADSVTTLNVQVPVDGDGLCYAGESYATGENCHDSPSDCGCDPGYFCKGVYNQGAPEYSCARIRIGHGCFLSGTQITMADGSTKPIESIDVGDEVRSLDPDTGEFIVGQVRSLSQANVGEYLLLNGKTKVTSVHRFYVPKHAAGIAKTSLGAESGQLDLANGEWIEIGKLPIGTMLLNSDGELVELKSLEPITASDTPVYNFEVYPQPNYIADGIVVHNRKPERIIAWEGDGGGGGGYAQ